MGKKIKDPIATERARAFKPNGEPLNVPIPRMAASALDDWMREHTEEIGEVLAPFGLHIHDVISPTWERALYLDEVSDD